MTWPRGPFRAVIGVDATVEDTSVMTSFQSLVNFPVDYLLESPSPAARTPPGASSLEVVFDNYLTGKYGKICLDYSEMRFQAILMKIPYPPADCQTVYRSFPASYGQFGQDFERALTPSQQPAPVLFV